MSIKRPYGAGRGKGGRSGKRRGDNGGLPIQAGGFTPPRFKEQCGPVTRALSKPLPKDPEAMAMMLADMPAAVLEKARNTAPEAFDTIVEIMRTARDTRGRLAACFKILELAGVGGKKISVDSGGLTEDAISAMQSLDLVVVVNNHPGAPKAELVKADTIDAEVHYAEEGTQERKQICPPEDCQQ